MAAAAASVFAVLGNFSQQPLPAIFVAVGGLGILKFALRVSCGFLSMTLIAAVFAIQ